MLPQPAQHTAPLAVTNPPTNLACLPSMEESPMAILLLRQSYFDPTAESSAALRCTVHGVEFIFSPIKQSLSTEL